MSQIFFSYARVDGEFALKLAKSLRSAGANVWIDQLDIPAGVPWPEAVQQGLKIAQSVLVILSPAAVESENVMNEVTFALEHGKRVVPVLYMACEIPLQLVRAQRIKFTGDFNRGFERLLREFNVERSSPDKTRRPWYLKLGRLGVVLLVLILIVIVVVVVKWRREETPSLGQGSHTPIPTQQPTGTLTPIRPQAPTQQPTGRLTPVRPQTPTQQPAGRLTPVRPQAPTQQPTGRLNPS
jgi:hypothetical protein